MPVHITVYNHAAVKHVKPWFVTMCCITNQILLNLCPFMLNGMKQQGSYYHKQRHICNKLPAKCITQHKLVYWKILLNLKTEALNPNGNQYSVTSKKSRGSDIWLSQDQSPALEITLEIPKIARKNTSIPAVYLTTRQAEIIGFYL